MNKTLLPLMLATLLLTDPAVASEPFKYQYFTIGVGPIRGAGLTLNRAVASYGLNLGRHFSLEGQVTRGIDDEYETINEIWQKVEARWGYGGFGVLRFPIGSRGGDVFLRAGFEDNKLRTEYGRLSGEGDMRGFSYGIGFNVFSGVGGGVRLLYSRIRESEARAFTVSYRLQF